MSQNQCVCPGHCSALKILYRKPAQKYLFGSSTLSRKDPSDAKELDKFYKRPLRHSFAVENFLEHAAVDYPGQKGSTAPKKVLTKTMEVLLRDFKCSHPNVKMSLTTFKRRRPRHILLSSSRKFCQCLCETCTNADIMLMS